MQFRWIVIGLVLTGMGTGCYELREGMDDWTMSTKTHFQARRAWHRLKPYYEELPHCGHFKDGFLEGYCTVACGGTGCQPTLPPRDYWSVWYQNPEGQQMQHAWFDGYSHGALAAEQDNVPVWNQIVLSNQAQTHLAAEDAEHHISTEVEDPLSAPPPAPPAEDAANRPSSASQGDVMPASHEPGPAFPTQNSNHPTAPSDEQGKDPLTEPPAAYGQPSHATPSGQIPQQPYVFPHRPPAAVQPGTVFQPPTVPARRHHSRPSVREKILKALKPVTHNYNPASERTAR